MTQVRKSVIVIVLIVLLPVSGAAQSNLILSGSEIRVQADAGTVEIPFILKNTGNQPVSGPAIEITDLPPGWSIESIETDGGTASPDERQVLYLNLDDDESVTPTWTLKLPENPGTCTYTVTGNLLVDGSTVQSVDSSITVGDNSAGSGVVHQNAVLQSGQTFWRGQGLFFNASQIIDGGANTNQSERTFLIRQVSDGNNVGVLVKQFTVDSDGETLLRTGCLNDKYVIMHNGRLVEVGTEGKGSIVTDQSEQTIQNAAWEVNTHSLSAEIDEDETLVRPGQTVAIDIESNRANYVMNVSAKGLNSDELADIFNQPDDGNNIQYVDAGTDVVGIEARSDSNIIANFSVFTDPGRYDFEFDVTDTSASATVSVELNQTDRQLAFTRPRVFTEEEGDRVNVSVKISDGSQAWVFIGDEDVNFLERVGIEDENEDGSVTLTVNTFRLHNHSTEAYEASNGDEILGVTQFAGQSAPGHQHLANLSIDPQTTMDKSIEAGQYELRVGTLKRVEVTDGTLELALQEDSGVIDLRDRSTESIRTLVAPTGPPPDDIDEILSDATERQRVTLSDRLIVQVRASGLYGYLTDDEIQTLFQQGLELKIEQTNPAPNREPVAIDPTGDGVRLYTQPNEDTFYLVFDLRNVDLTSGRELQDGQRHDVVFSIYGGGDETPEFPLDRTDSNPYVKPDRRERVSTSVTFETPAAEFTDVRSDILQITPSQETRIRGRSNLAPNSEVTIQLRGTDGYPLSAERTAVVTKDGTFVATFDTANVPVGTNFTATIRRSGNELSRLDGRVVSQISTPTPTPTPTATVRSPTPKVETIVKTQSPVPSPSPQVKTRTVVRTEEITKTIIRTPTDTPGQPGFSIMLSIIAVFLFVLRTLLLN